MISLIRRMLGIKDCKELIANQKPLKSYVRSKLVKGCDDRYTIQTTYGLHRQYEQQGRLLSTI